MTAKVKWEGRGLEFDGTASGDMHVKLASGMDVGVSGFRPMELVGVGLAGCTAMDVLSILKKKRQDVVDFEVLFECSQITIADLAGIIHGDAQHHHPLLFVLVLQRDQFGNGLPAGGAPGSPEIQQHNLSPVLIEAHRFPRDFLKGKSRGTIPTLRFTASPTEKESQKA